eukprot:1863648-Rhodomonas_salina.1
MTGMRCSLIFKRSRGCWQWWTPKSQDTSPQSPAAEQQRERVPTAAAGAGLEEDVVELLAAAQT